MKKYIGDGVYCEIQDGLVVITTSNGIIDTNTIIMEENVINNFIEFLQREWFKQK